MQNASNYTIAYISFIRAAYNWFHAAHHVTSGTGFSGDHALYAEIYEDYLEVLDGIIEKSVGTCGIENIAAPLPTLKLSLEILAGYPSPESLTSLAIASAALKIERDYLEVVEEFFTTLESLGQLPLGLNDFLAASANKHDTYVYKLTQRVKTEVQD
jgi:hypothetical protein